MNSYTRIYDETEPDTCIKSKKLISDTIYTFDIETTSLFNYGDHYDVFDYSKLKEEYSNIDKIAITYIWQFGINDRVYYGRELYDFEKVLKQISDKNITKVIWVHNLSYEQGFLENILRHYTVTDMCARDVRKPISFYVKELNIIFRCSYMLTNMSLEKSAKEYTNVNKLDTLDYDSKIRTPLTKLTDKEMMYCEYDIICLYEIIKYYLNKYGHIAMIPLTATGEVRAELRHHIDFWYIKHQWELVPSPNMYLRLMACFQGGYTHANVLNVNKVHNNVKSYDISSSYPTVMCLEQFPATPFTYIDYDEYKTLDKEKYCIMFHVKLFDVKSKYYNNYISFSKCVNFREVKPKDIDELVYDNGRVQKAKMVEMWLTDVDLDIIQTNYHIGRIQYEAIYISEKRYLDIRVIQFILELYNNKTKLKNVSGSEDIYKKSKSYINSLYGMSVTNALKNSTCYSGGVWSKKELTIDFVRDILEKSKKSYSTLFFYAVGVWVTAYARRNLYKTILSSHEFDRDVIYCDTDSIKYKGDHDDIFQHYNEEVFQKYKKVCEKFSQLNVELFTPSDKNGNIHPLGIFDYEGEYQKFKTLGAKKYCYVDDSLHITVSGVSKKGACALKSIDDFKNGFEWGYKESGKLAHYYNEEQPHITVIDADGNEYRNTYDYGVVLQPTTYTLGVTDVYISLYENIQEKELRK